MSSQGGRSGRSWERAHRSKKTVRTRQDNNSTVCGDPYGILSGVDPGQKPHYRSSGRLYSYGWSQSRASKSAADQRSEFSSRENGPRDGGSFGAIAAVFGYAYADIYPGEATTDPDYLESAGQKDGGLRRGYGELVPGLDGGRAYGYRRMNERFALAEWGDIEPHVPGRGRFVSNDEAASNKCDEFGYRTIANYGNYPQPREFNDHARAGMERQLPDGQMVGRIRLHNDLRPRGDRK